MGCIDSTVFGFLLPLTMLIAFGSGCGLMFWMGTAQRRKAAALHEQLLREKDAFKTKEIETYQLEAAKWRKEAELVRSASDAYKRILDSHGIKYERATMLFSPDGTAVDDDMGRSVSRSSMLKVA